MGKFRIKYTKQDQKKIIFTRIEEIDDTLDPEYVINKLNQDKENKYIFFNENINILEIEKIE
ncbi:MAG: hypothetical protein M1168_01500 [Candidatus Marsarchaeota archaeon]|nr:hypothetical protein [Candidatus Marsarchaeota archaeon]MCL5094639.1 hypothetical protein [Candidatus Marsarchaeota archaeon]